jgi:hypothetical protein
VKPFDEPQVWTGMVYKPVLATLDRRGLSAGSLGRPQPSREHDIGASLIATTLSEGRAPQSLALLVRRGVILDAPLPVAFERISVGRPAPRCHLEFRALIFRQSPEIPLGAPKLDVPRPARDGFLAPCGSPLGA